MRFVWRAVSHAHAQIVCTRHGLFAERQRRDLGLQPAMLVLGANEGLARVARALLRCAQARLEGTDLVFELLYLSPPADGSQSPLAGYTQGAATYCRATHPLYLFQILLYTIDQE